MNTIDVLGDAEVFKRIMEKTIEEFEDDQVTTMAYHCGFNDCTRLKRLSLPNVTRVMRVSNLSSLEYFSAPKAETVNGLNNAPMLTYIDVSNAREFSSASNCPNVQILNLPKATNIPYGTLRGWSGLRKLIVGTDNGGVVCTLGGSGSYTIPQHAFQVYVPDELVSAYKSASNWSDIASNIYPISTYT